MSDLVKRLVSSALLGALWLVPVARASAATSSGSERPVPVETAPVAPAPSAPASSTFAELFPFGALASAAGLAASEMQGTSEDSYAAREAGATELQDFRGGAVSIYVGSGALLVLIIILVVLLV